ncbi:hypothetical protein A2333_02875 [Candidatus Wolfebacteria bacterium RIFOXYB2_FULL_49_7]|uniref:Uncharacterized protein n=1 Tax=Candidatus Wolfebacteria bacterium RIFOXYB1_FULL_54_12 TaxID=1802559 RepID=A0A1F8DZ47_9BACT|nr:MAG: hypothetical protein A2372_03150 [Candidatus Wolfebacteria bacterium RIFOXYB1_FULL_54_12]OGM96708.1 MAG: hypothetical protein A2333_02875 [Candidatus Wolfebacteria bacterium RIFOXYB2_FULL_49_7]
MARVKDKEKAIQLRLTGKSYSQIKSELGVSKSTLSGWLKEYPLSKEQFGELNVVERRVESYISTCKIRKEQILKEVYDKEKKEIFPLSKRDLFVAGLFLYWGEGGKTDKGSLVLSNTNPAVIKFGVYWMENTLGVKKDKITARLHLYKDMNIDDEINFWSKELGFKKDQFSNPYIKNSNKAALTYKVGFGHGTCNIRIGNVILRNKVLMGLKAVEDHFNAKK